MDGNEMLEKCKPFFNDISGTPNTTMTNTERINMGYCAGYLSGVTDVEAMWRVVEGATSRSTHYCMHEDVTNEQVLRILKKWLDKNPDKLHWRADDIIHAALLDAFPCK